MTISVCINVDSRVGFDKGSSLTGEFENGQPNGTRSLDYLTEGIIGKMKYFRGFNTQCILYIDHHQLIPPELLKEITGLVLSYGNNSKIVCKPHDRTRYRWNDKLYLEALKLADGDYVAHFDGDCNAYRANESDIVDAYIDLLETYKYICCPIMPHFKHEWYHASTQFFICKRETLDFNLIENSLYTPLRGKHAPCLEFVLGILAGEGNVLYPPRTDDEYIIFCWWKYQSGLLKKLNEMEYKDVIDFISKCGLTSTSF